ERASRADVLEERFVEFPGLRLTDTDRDSNTGLRNPGEATADHQRIGVTQRYHDATHPSPDHRVSTRRGFAGMATRFEVAVQPRPTSAQASLLQRVYFRMGATKTLVIAPPDNLAVFDDHTADERIGTDKPYPPSRQVQGLLHILHIDCGVVCHGVE